MKCQQGDFGKQIDMDRYRVLLRFTSGSLVEKLDWLAWIRSQSAIIRNCRVMRTYLR